MIRQKSLTLIFTVAVFSIFLSLPASGQVSDTPYMYSNPALQQDAFIRNLNATAVNGLVQRQMMRDGFKAKGSSRSRAAARTTSPTTFQGSKEYIVAGQFAKTSKAPAAEKAQAVRFLEQAYNRYLQTAVKDGFPPNDLAYAFEYFVVNNYHVYHNVFESTASLSSTDIIDVSKIPNFINYASEKALFQQFGTVLSGNPAVAKLSHYQKQQYTEMLATMTNIIFAAYERGIQNKDRKAINEARQAAKQSLEQMFGVPADKITVGEQGLSFEN